MAVKDDSEKRFPVFAFELKNQFKGQNVDNSKRQWMYDRDKRELCFQFNSRILGYFCVDLTEAWMTTRLDGKDTFFPPFNQGSNGAGQDGGKRRGRRRLLHRRVIKGVVLNQYVCPIVPYHSFLFKK